MADKCVKCGGEDVHVRFFREGSEDVQVSYRFDYRDCRWSNIPKGCRNDHGSLTALNDLLRKSCRVCGWWWTDAPKDAEVSNG